MFVNRVVLYDDHCEIYFNITSDKTKQLKLSEKPDISQEIEYIENKKEQSSPTGSDCSQLAERGGFEPPMPVRAYRFSRPTH